SRRLVDNSTSFIDSLEAPLDIGDFEHRLRFRARGIAPHPQHYLVATPPGLYRRPVHRRPSPALTPLRSNLPTARLASFGHRGRPPTSSASRSGNRSRRSSRRLVHTRRIGFLLSGPSHGLFPGPGFGRPS